MPSCDVGRHESVYTGAKSGWLWEGQYHFFFKWSFSFILSTISEQSFAWGKKGEESFFLINAVEFQEPYFSPVFLSKSRKECSEELTFHSFSYFEINISNFLKTNSLNHSWNCSTWAYSFLSLHFYVISIELRRVCRLLLFQACYSPIPQMLQLPDAWVLIT